MPLHRLINMLIFATLVCTHTVGAQEKESPGMVEGDVVAQGPKSAYYPSPWRPIPSIFQEAIDKKELLWSIFSWKHGGRADFAVDLTFNSSFDTTYALLPPSQVDIPFNIGYTHRFNKVLWVGGSVSRSHITSPYFDSLYIDRQGWFQRMGFDVHVGLPGCMYSLHRDPRLIPKYGRYDREALVHLTENGKGEYTKLKVKESSSFVGEDANGDSTTRSITIPEGIGHTFSFKASVLSYALTIDPNRYDGPIHDIKIDDLPFFKGTWGMGVVILPSARAVPSLHIGFYTLAIPLGESGKYQLNITPVDATLELWGNEEYFFSAAITSEFLHLKKPNAY